MLRNVFLFLFTIGTFLGVLVVTGIGLFEEVTVDMNCCSLHGAAFDIAKRAGQIYASWTKSLANIADPTFSWHFSKPHAPLVQTDVAHATKDDEVIVSVISICAYLAFGIFVLSISVLLLVAYFITRHFFTIFNFALLFHVLEVLLFFWVELVDKFKRVFSWNRHERICDLRQLDSWQVRLHDADDLIQRHVQDRFQD